MLIMKNRKVALIFNILLLLSAALPAQEHTISLKGKILNLPDNPYQVVEVIDAREEKCCLGFVGNLPLGNTKVNIPVIIEPGLSESLLSLLKTGFSEASSKTQIIIKINRLFVYDLWGKKNFNNVLEINLDFYVREGGAYYHELNTGQCINYSFSLLDSKQKLEEIIATGAENCCKEFLHRMKNNLGYHEKTNENELYENSLNQNLLTKIKNQNRKDGIYYTFSGFRDNLADTVNTYSLNSLGGRYNSFGFKKLTIDNKKIKRDDIWGVSFDNKLYVKNDGVMIPVEYSENGFIINHLPYSRKSTALFLGAGIGFTIAAGFGLLAYGPVAIFDLGLLGLSGALTGAGIGGLTYIDNMYEVSKSPHRIDMATGMIVLVEEPAYRKFAGELVFFIEKYKGQNPELYVNGEKITSFQPKSYVSVVVPMENNTVEICLKSTNDEFCKTVSVDIFNTNYYQVKIREDGQVKFIPITAEKKKLSKQKKIEDGKFVKIDSAIE